MAFKPVNTIFKGDIVYTSKEHSSLSGTFEIGTKVTVIGRTLKGYDIEDELGNRICEIGWVI